jgi:tetratricopeptide (TPR) repeat protein
MKKIIPVKYLVSLSALISISLAPAFGQQTLWISHEEAGGKAYNAGKYAEAERLFNEALSAAKNINQNDSQLARTYNDLGTVYKELGKYAQAEEVLTKAISLVEKSEGSESPLMGYALNNLATVYGTQAKYTEAEALYKKVLDIGEQKAKKQKNIGLLAIPLNNLANGYINRGDYAEAQKMLDRALALYEKSKVPKDQAYVATKINSGLLYQCIGQYKASEEEYQAALTDCEQILGKNHPRYSVALVGLANCYVKEGRYKEAEQYMERAKDVVEQSSGSDRTEMASLLGFTARLYAAEGRYQEADPLAKQALELVQKKLGPEHTTVANCLLTQGEIMQSQGRYDAALEKFSQAKAIYEKVLGEANPRVALAMKDIGSVYLDENKYADAESTLKQALATAQKRLEPGHSDIADIQRLLASAYAGSGKLTDAEALYKQAIQTTETSLGKEHPQYADSIRDLARLHQKLGKANDAASLLNQALQIDEKEFGANSAKIASDLDLLTNLAMAQKEQAKAYDYAERAQKIKASLPGSGNLASLLNAENDNAAKLKEAAKPVADKWALVIGISNFADSTINLRYAAKDATDFRSFLIAKENFQPDHVKLLTDQNATSQNIKDQLGDKWLGHLADPDDLIIVYLSTHGSDQIDVSDTKVNFLVAHDTDKNKLVSTGLPMKFLTNIIKEQVRSNRVVLIMDVCHSGAAAPGEKNLLRPAAASTSAKGVDAQKLPLGAGQTVLCSSLSDQVSWESKHYPNSVFTKQLMQALQIKGDATTMTEAYNALKDGVESEVLRDRGQVQTPILNTKFWTGGDAALAVKPAKPRKAK